MTDTALTQGFNQTEKEKIIVNTLSVHQFVVLTIATFGLYNVWWVYKSWSFFRTKEKSDILAAVRTIFSIIFLIPLFNKISKLAGKFNYDKKYSSVLQFLGLWCTNLLGYLPEPYFMIAFFSFVFIIPPFKALNFGMMHSEGFQVVEQDRFNGRQIFLIVVGSVFWLLVLIGLFI